MHVLVCHRKFIPNRFMCIVLCSINFTMDNKNTGYRIHKKLVIQRVMASYNLAENCDITKSKMIPKFSNVIQLSIDIVGKKSKNIHPCMILHARYIFSNFQRTQSSFKSTDVETHVYGGPGVPRTFLFMKSHFNLISILISI